MIIASIEDYRKRCEARLPGFLYNYNSGGSYQENTLRANVADLQATLLRQRVLVDESHLNLSIDLWDQALTLPVILGPVGMAGMYSSRGEVKAARAAKAWRSVYAVDHGSVRCTRGRAKDRRSTLVPALYAQGQRVRQRRDRTIRFGRLEGLGVHRGSSDSRATLQRCPRRDGERPDTPRDAGVRRSRRDAPPLGPRYRH